MRIFYQTLSFYARHSNPRNVERRTSHVERTAPMRNLLLPYLLIALHVSADAQLFWVPAQGPLGEDVSALHITAAGTIWAGTAEAGLFWSGDNGASWQAVEEPRLAESTIEAIGQTSDGHVFVGTVGQGVLVSEDGGSSWVASNSGLRDLRVEVLLVTPNDEVFVGTGDGLYQRSDTSWRDVSGGLVRRDIRALALNAADEVLAGVFREGVFRATGLGPPWIASAEGMEARIIRSIHVDDQGNLFVAAWDGRQAYRSTDNGVTWTAIGEGLPGRGIWDITSDAAGILYAGTAGQGVYRSTDAAVTWQKSTLPDVTVSAVAYHPDGSVWAGTRIGVFRSADQGQSWQLMGLPRSRVYAFASDDQYLYTSTRFGGVFRSDDGGKTWTPTALQGVIPFVLHLTPTGALLAGTRDEGIFRSTDHGATWTLQGLNFHTIYALEAFDDKRWAATERGVYQSIDDGLTWALHSLADQPVGELLVDAEGTLHAAVDGTGLFRSTDQGTHWEPQQTDTPISQVWTLFATASGTRLAGTSGQGIFRFEEETDRWVHVGLPMFTVTSFIEAPDGTLWASTWRGQIFTSTDDGLTWTVQVEAEGFILRTLFIDTAGTLMAGTHEHGVLRHEGFISTAQEWTDIPASITVDRVYPNPFRSSTTLSFTLAQPTQVNVAIYDLRGAEVAALAHGRYAAGAHRVQWVPGSLANGMYLMRVRAGSVDRTQKVIVQR